MKKKKKKRTKNDTKMKSHGFIKELESTVYVFVYIRIWHDTLNKNIYIHRSDEKEEEESGGYNDIIMYMSSHSGQLVNWHASELCEGESGE